MLFEWFVDKVYVTRRACTVCTYLFEDVLADLAQFIELRKSEWFVVKLVDVIRTLCTGCICFDGLI